jgi:hypothetical protein
MIMCDNVNNNNEKTSNMSQWKIIMKNDESNINMTIGQWQWKASN